MDWKMADGRLLFSSLDMTIVTNRLKQCQSFVKHQMLKLRNYHIRGTFDGDFNLAVWRS